MEQKTISLLIPCYNEEESLPLLYPELAAVLDAMPQYGWEILFVNDGSRDRTLDLLRELHRRDSRVSYVSLSRNFGKEKAMLAGFDYVRGDAMIILDADLQDPPSVIPEMVRYWEEGYEDVYARRADRGKESFLRRRFSLLYYRILQRMTDIEILPNVGDFRLLDRACIEALKELRESERYTKGMFCWIGFRKKEIRFDRGNRAAGKSAWNFRSLFGLAVEGITSFSVAPLRISTWTGFIVSLAAFAYMIFILVKTLLYGDPVQGFPTIMTVMLFLGGVQLLSIGILGEYIGRIFHETKRRPTYIAAEYNGKRVIGNSVPPRPGNENSNENSNER